MKEQYLTITQLSRYLKYKFDQDTNLNTVYLKHILEVIIILH